MATNPPSCLFIQFLEQLLKFLVNFTLSKYVKPQRSYGFLFTKGLIFGFQILDVKDCSFSTLSINTVCDFYNANGYIITFDEMKQRGIPDTSYYIWLQIIYSIPKSWKAMIRGADKEILERHSTFSKNLIKKALGRTVTLLLISHIKMCTISSFQEYENLLHQ